MSLHDFISYWWLGFRHVIPEGADHMLFMLALILRGESLRKSVIRCTLFTIGHAFSMFLVLYSPLPDLSAVIEPLIAGSIVFASVSNLFPNRKLFSQNLIIGIFGLIHGCGFANALHIAHPELNISFSLLVGFNTGVETVQVLMIVVCTLAAMLVLKKHPAIKIKLYNWMSVLVAMAGLYLLMKHLTPIN